MNDKFVCVQPIVARIRGCKDKNFKKKNSVLQGPILPENYNYYHVSAF